MPASALLKLADTCNVALQDLSPFLCSEGGDLDPSYVAYFF